MIYLFIVNVILFLVLGYFIYYSYKKSIYHSKRLCGDIVLNINRKIEQIEQSTTEQKEVNKYFTIEQATQDQALIQLIDIPYLYEELDPGWPKEWSGEVPFKIKEEYVNSEIKMKYVYTIITIKGNYIELSRK